MRFEWICTAYSNGSWPGCEEYGSLANEATALSQRASSLCFIHPELMQVPGGHKEVSAAAVVYVVRPSAEG